MHVPVIKSLVWPLEPDARQVDMAGNSQSATGGPEWGWIWALRATVGYNYYGAHVLCKC